MAGLIKSHPGINVVFCNGGEAEKQFRTNILNKLNRPILYKRLYSTSPANASIPFQKSMITGYRYAERLKVAFCTNIFLIPVSGQLRFIRTAE